MMRIFSAREPFDHDGEFYKMKGVIAKPQPLQMPRPLTMSAATSPAGREFAPRTSDLLVTTLGVAGEELAAVSGLVERRKAQRVATADRDHHACRLPRNRRGGRGVLSSLRR
jgi:dimethylsulfone monooxygenase